MRKLLLLTVALTAIFSANAQQDPQFSMFQHNRLFPNPGVAGSNDMICGTAILREQWSGFEGNPRTFMISGHMPITIPYIGESGVGLAIAQDQLGQETSTLLKGIYAWRKQLGDGKLGVGLGLGMLGKSIGADWTATDDYELDPSINNVGASDFNFDLDFGLYYKKEGEYYVGLSATHLLANQINVNAPGEIGQGAFVYQVARHYYLQAGYTYEMTSDLDLLPNLLVKSDGQTNQIDVNAVVMYQDKFWGGLSYRFQDAIAPMAGVQMPLKNGYWKIGYSYDVTTSRLAQNSSGSHEIMLGICLPYSKPPTSSQHRTVRFL